MNEVDRVLDAVVAISSGLDLPSVLQRITAAACDLSGAQYGALGVLGSGEVNEEIELIEFITHGVDAATAARIGHYPRGLGILGLLIREPRPIRLHDLSAHPQSAGFPDHHPAMTSFLGVPVRIREEVFGNLYLTEKSGGGDFTVQDEETVVALASAAGVAIENARLHERVREMAVLQDRERIARDLHDTVIQRLFATGLSLQGLSRRVDDGEVAERIQQSVDDLDATIRDIRGVIFALQAHESGEASVRVLVMALAAELQGTLGFEPRVHFDGPVDTVIEGDLADEVVVVIREMLSNVVRHAAATAVDVEIRVGTDVVVRVSDNGRGPGERRAGGRGLGNLDDRARRRRGGFSLADRPGGGSTATWTIPRPRTGPKVSPGRRAAR